MQYLLDQSPQGLRSWMSQHGHRPYRAGQLQHWIWKRRAVSFATMTDLPEELRRELAGEFQLWSSRVVESRKSADGTEKLLLELTDGGRIECVLLRDGRRRSICISSQVGCAMGCVFCASGLNGVERNLTTGEIVEQMLRLQQLLPAGERLSHIVVMGMGEPLANLNALLPALEQASSSDGLGVSTRRITISTVGIPSAMRRLSQARCGYHLAVSLHAADDQLRNRLVPVNKSTGLAEILAAADDYFAQSGRRLTFEYVLLADVNDQPLHARQLVNLLRGRGALLNVIPYNPVTGLPFQTPSPPRIRGFRQILLDGGLNVRFRKRKGSEIDAACGQLRRTASAAISLTAAAGEP